MTSRPFPPQLMSYDVDAFSPFLQEHPLVSEFHDIPYINFIDLRSGDKKLKK